MKKLSILASLAVIMSEVFGMNNVLPKKDDSLIDGLQIRYGSKVLDCSIRSKLERLKKSMKGESKI